MSQSIHHVFTLFAFFLAGCAQPVLVESIRAKVVDDSSGEPLEGVHVVFKATAYEGTFTGHGGRKVNLLVAEGITNATGIIELPAQKIDPEPFWFNTHYDYPWIYFFKSGYLPAIEKNPWNGLASLETVQRWQYNGKTVRLKKPNYFNEYIEKISFLGNEIERIYRYPPPEQCEWKRIPRMFLYLDREYSLILERARQANRYLSLPTIASLQQHYWESRCGSAIEFFGKYGGSQ